MPDGSTTDKDRLAETRRVPPLERENTAKNSRILEVMFRDTSNRPISRNTNSTVVPPVIVNHSSNRRISDITSDNTNKYHSLHTVDYNTNNRRISQKHGNNAETQSILYLTGTNANNRHIPPPDGETAKIPDIPTKRVDTAHHVKYFPTSAKDWNLTLAKIFHEESPHESPVQHITQPTLSNLSDISGHSSSSTQPTTVDSYPIFSYTTFVFIPLLVILLLVLLSCSVSTAVCQPVGGRVAPTRQLAWPKVPHTGVGLKEGPQEDPRAHQIATVDI